MNGATWGSDRTGALIGLIGALGALLIYLGLPRHRRITLQDRIAPYLRDTPIPSRLLAASRQATGGRWQAVLTPTIEWAAGWVETLLGGAETVARRQQRCGLPVDVARFRAQQVVWGFLGAAAAAGLGVLGLLTRGTSPVMVLALVVIGGLSAVVARDWTLTRAATRREQRMLVEFPTIAELLALSVSAGEGTVGALERICARSRGELTSELGRCLNDARAGASMTVALQGLADQTGLPSLARFVDGMVIAVERGTPLADVLRAQAQDVREDGRRALLEAGGKKEIAMMVPVVFLVLPITIVFAVFPGFSFFKFQL